MLAEPPKQGFDLLAWLLPLAALALGAVVVGGARLDLEPARGDEADEAEAALDPELERRVDEELARFED